MSKQVILYLPVVHSGYVKFLKEHEDANEILVLGRSFQDLFPQLRKDIRSVEPCDAVRMARPYVPGTTIRVVEKDQLAGALFADILVMPEEDIMHELVLRHQLDEKHEIYFESAFLRWDRSRAEMEREVSENEELSCDQLHQTLVGLAGEEAVRSPDWWRQVGAVAWRDNKVLFAAYNDHTPTSYAAVIEGDPRGGYRGGEMLELSIAEHAEAWIVGQAARLGVALEGATLAVTAFPCPPCAKLIVTAGIKELIFQTGYALVDGDELLRAAGIKIIRVAP